MAKKNEPVEELYKPAMVMPTTAIRTEPDGTSENVIITITTPFCPPS